MAFTFRKWKFGIKYLKNALLWNWDLKNALLWNWTYCALLRFSTLLGECTRRMLLVETHKILKRHVVIGARRNFSRVRQNQADWQKWAIFGAPMARTNIIGGTFAGKRRKFRGGSRDWLWGLNFGRLLLHKNHKIVHTQNTKNATNFYITSPKFTIFLEKVAKNGKKSRIFGAPLAKCYSFAGLRRRRKKILR